MEDILPNTKLNVSSNLYNSETGDREYVANAEPDKPIEWLAIGRARRSTAGNRMKSLVANEDPDDDLELLFAEAEDDAGFSDVEENASDVHMDSSDDEDENASDDMEGEKELEKEAKRKQAASKKRKRMDHIPTKFHKKVRISQPESPTAASSAITLAPKPRLKKKSERTSWLPSPAEMPTRASKRETTMMSKELLHMQMVEREARRQKQLKLMAEKQKRLEANKKPPMTQDERLREAAIVERRNTKSLNRWEEAEKQREEERKKKLAALNNRKLDGPVVTFWSGIQDSGGKAIAFVVEEAKKPRRKKSTTVSTGSSITAPSTAVSTAPVSAVVSPRNTVPDVALSVTETTSSVGPERAKEPMRPDPLSESQASSSTIQKLSTNLPASSGVLSAPTGSTPPSVLPESSSPVLERAPQLPRPSGLTPPPIVVPPSAEPRPSVSSVLAMPGSTPMLSSMASSTVNPKASALGIPHSTLVSSPLSLPPLTAASPIVPLETAQSSQLKPAITKSDTSHIKAIFSLASLPPADPSTSVKPPIPMPSQEADSGSISAEKLPSKANNDIDGKENMNTSSNEKDQKECDVAPSGDKIVRRLIVLQNFDENAIKDKTVQMRILFNQKMSKLPKPPSQPLCVITNHPAKYKDPKTSLPYSNTYAFRMIRRLYDNDYRFSGLLGAYVGSQSFAARGVPPRFLKPEAERLYPKEPPKQMTLAGESSTTTPQSAATTLGPAQTTQAPAHSQSRFQVELPTVVSATHPSSPQIKPAFRSSVESSSNHRAMQPSSPIVPSRATALVPQSQFQPTTLAQFQPTITPTSTSHQPKIQTASALVPPISLQRNQAPSKLQQPSQFKSSEPPTTSIMQPPTALHPPLAPQHFTPSLPSKSSVPTSLSSSSSSMTSPATSVPSTSIPPPPNLEVPPAISKSPTEFFTPSALPGSPSLTSLQSSLSFTPQSSAPSSTTIFAPAQSKTPYTIQNRVASPLSDTVASNSLTPSAIGLEAQPSPTKALLPSPPPVLTVNNDAVLTTKNPSQVPAMSVLSPKVQPPSLPLLTDNKPINVPLPQTPAVDPKAGTKKSFENSTAGATPVNSKSTISEEVVTQMDKCNNISDDTVVTPSESQAQTENKA